MKHGLDYVMVMGSIMYLGSLGFDFEKNSAQDLLEAVGELLEKALEDDELTKKLIKVFSISQHIAETDIAEMLVH